MSNEEIMEKIISELKELAFTDFSRIAHTMDSERHADFIRQLAEYESFFPCIAQVKAVKDGVEIKFYDKLKAIELLAKFIQQQDKNDASGDFDNLISVLQGRAEQIWKGGDTD